MSEHGEGPGAEQTPESRPQELVALCCSGFELLRCVRNVLNPQQMLLPHLTFTTGDHDGPVLKMRWLGHLGGSVG